MHLFMPLLMHLLMLLLMHLFMLLLMHLLILLTAQLDRKQLTTAKMQGARERNAETPDFLRSVAQNIGKTCSTSRPADHRNWTVVNN